MSEFLLDAHPVVFLRPHLSFPFAWAGHIPFAYFMVDVLRPRSFVELGTDSGNSYLAFCQAVRHLNVDARCTAIDSWHGDEHARKYPDEVYRTLKAYHDPRYAEFSELKRCLFDEAVGDFPDRSIDLLHFDGLHSYEAVAHDFEAWLPKLSERGVVLLHDTQVRDRGFGVYRLLEELAERYPVFEFTHSNGLGVVQVGVEPPEAFKRFMASTQQSPGRIRNYFSAIARTIVDDDGTSPASMDVACLELVCSLFHRTRDQSFSEERLQSVGIMGDLGEQLVEFVLPEGTRPDFIRLDPSEVPGAYRIRGLSLSVNGDETTVRVVNDLQARVGFAHCDLYPSSNFDEVRFVSLERDPYLEVDISDAIRELPTIGGLVVRFHLHIETVLPDPRLWKLASSQAQALLHVRTASSQSFGMHTLLAQLGQNEHHLAGQVEQVRSELAQQLDQLRELVRAGHLRQTEFIDELREREARVEKLFAAVRASEASSVEQLDALQASQSRQEAALRVLLKRGLIGRLRSLFKRTS